MDSTGLNPEDDFMVIKGIKVNRKTFAIDGIYKDNVLVDKKDMTQEELLRAHDIVRKHSFDLT